MAKRLQLNFHHAGPTMVAEAGQPRPCAMGVPWVNADTLATLRKVYIPRTDQKGRVIPATDGGTGAHDSSVKEDLPYRKA
jgi:hypothetical protein